MTSGVPKDCSQARQSTLPQRHWKWYRRQHDDADKLRVDLQALATYGDSVHYWHQWVPSFAGYVLVSGANIIAPSRSRIRSENYSLTQFLESASNRFSFG